MNTRVLWLIIIAQIVVTFTGLFLQAINVISGDLALGITIGAFGMSESAILIILFNKGGTRMKAFTAWVIDTNSKEGHGLIGRYWWFAGKYTVPPHLEGCRSAMFTTRKIAREHLPDVKKSFPGATVRKARVSIDT